MLDSDPNGVGSVGVTVCDLDSQLMVCFGQYLQAGGQLQPLFRVTVVRPETASAANLPDVVGRYEVLEDGFRFIPHFPFERGLSYRASFDSRSLGFATLSDVLTLEFTLQKWSDTLPPEVDHIYPSSDRLPDNLLRFYVCFSGPMQRGRAEAAISVLGPDGERVPDVLYRVPAELWDRNMQCLTILLDPGRLKRGVGPNRELGPPLRAGQRYTLSVGASMTDLSGRQLSEAVYKRFGVTDAVREPINTEQWQLDLPTTKSHEPLVLIFPRPLDWALLAHTITVASSDGQSPEGRIAIDQFEKRWSFTPSLPWAAGAYHVRVTPGLEDVCGNSIIAPFDRPIRAGSNLPYAEVGRSIHFCLL